jgi:acyl-ACP thioesterase
MTNTVGAADLAGGRRFRAGRRVRLGDVSPSGRLRLDAILRYLQDVGDDDTIDAGLDDATGWVVRRTVLHVTRFGRYQELLNIETWCSGIGGRWAERSTRLTGDQGAAIDASTIWVHIDPVAQQARQLPASFLGIYGEAAAGRKVSAKLHHGPVPEGCSLIDWAVRYADYDVMGHVNNAVVAEFAEEQLARRRELRAPLTATFEYRAEVTPASSVRMAVLDQPDGCAFWLLDGGSNPLVSVELSSPASRTA